jgi:hypothetical protein
MPHTPKSPMLTDTNVRPAGASDVTAAFATPQQATVPSSLLMAHAAVAPTASEPGSDEKRPVGVDSQAGVSSDLRLRP